jgi:uncharacterized protein (DUF169 family)
LGECEFEPDVIILEAEPEQLMWLALAVMYENGERLQFQTSVVQATCVDCTVVPHKTQKINATLGCTGCREASNIATVEGLMGIPFVQLELVMQNLLRLSEKVIPKNRSKPSYERFKENA